MGSIVGRWWQRPKSTLAGSIFSGSLQQSRGWVGAPAHPLDPLFCQSPAKFAGFLFILVVEGTRKIFFCIKQSDELFVTFQYEFKRYITFK
jgi:hypothetical protein